MRILYVTSEVFPLIKTGGLADVSAALPASLAALGAEVGVMVPAYARVLDEACAHGAAVPLGDLLGAGEVSLIPARTPDTDVPLWLVDCPPLYRRADAPYQSPGYGHWPDDDLRFAVLSHAAARLGGGVAGLAWRPDVVHTNDWQGALTSLLLAHRGTPRPATVFTVHNLAFQGLFPLARAAALRVPPQYLSSEGIEFHGRLSLLKAGIRYADALTTVSHTYAREIQTPAFGCGLDGLLRARAQCLHGIPNGVDYALWNPGTDVHLPQRYDAGHMRGKRACKRALQRELGLDVAPEVPLCVFVSRITEQKMADLIAETVPWLIESGAQFALLGEGDALLERRFEALAAQHPGRVATRIGYGEALAHRFHAGADILLHPARFEPGGLVPLYAMRYGAVPLVRRVGGLADSVVDADASAVAAGTATGFAFTDVDVAALQGCMARTLSHYRHPVGWRRLRRRAMQQDFGWQHPARTYLALYEALAQVAAHDAHRGPRRRSFSAARDTAAGAPDRQRTPQAVHTEARAMADDPALAIRERAYAIWDRAGRPHGMHEAHWLRAQAEICAERSAETPQAAPARCTLPNPATITCLEQPADVHRPSIARPASREPRRRG